MLGKDQVGQHAEENKDEHDGEHQAENEAEHGWESQTYQHSEPAGSSEQSSDSRVSLNEAMLSLNTDDFADYSPIKSPWCGTPSGLLALTPSRTQQELELPTAVKTESAEDFLKRFDRLDTETRRCFAMIVARYESRLPRSEEESKTTSPQ